MPWGPFGLPENKAPAPPPRPVAPTPRAMQDRLLESNTGLNFWGPIASAEKARERFLRDVAPQASRFAPPADASIDVVDTRGGPRVDDPTGAGDITSPHAIRQYTGGAWQPESRTLMLNVDSHDEQGVPDALDNTYLHEIFHAFANSPEDWGKDLRPLFERYANDRGPAHPNAHRMRVQHLKDLVDNIARGARGKIPVDFLSARNLTVPGLNVPPQYTDRALEQGIEELGGGATAFGPEALLRLNIDPDQRRLLMNLIAKRLPGAWQGSIIPPAPNAPRAVQRPMSAHDSWRSGRIATDLEELGHMDPYITGRKAPAMRAGQIPEQVETVPSVPKGPVGATSQWNPTGLAPWRNPWRQ